jgi:hypothetical protein
MVCVPSCVASIMAEHTVLYCTALCLSNREALDPWPVRSFIRAAGWRAFARLVVYHV